MSKIIFLNLTTESYFIGKNREDCAKILQELMSPLNKDMALLEEDIGESHWKNGDLIVYVPRELHDHTKEHFNRVYV